MALNRAHCRQLMYPGYHFISTRYMPVSSSLPAKIASATDCSGAPSGRWGTFQGMSSGRQMMVWFEIKLVHISFSSWVR